jgi:hypothetical protein
VGPNTTNAEAGVKIQDQKADATMIGMGYGNPLRIARPAPSASCKRSLRGGVGENPYISSSGNHRAKSRYKL